MRTFRIQLTSPLYTRNLETVLVQIRRCFGSIENRYSLLETGLMSKAVSDYLFTACYQPSTRTSRPTFPCFQYLDTYSTDSSFIYLFHSTCNHDRFIPFVVFPHSQLKPLRVLTCRVTIRIDALGFHYPIAQDWLHATGILGCKYE